MPTAIASTASRILSGRRSDSGKYCAKPAHSNTVAVDPHVPGPGRMVPTPKNVATSHDHKGPRVLAGTAASVWLVSIVIVNRTAAAPGRRRTFSVIRLAAGFRVVHGRRDHVSATRPPSKVDGTAALAAKRKIGFIPQNQLAAGRTTQAANFLLGHNRSKVESLKSKAKTFEVGVSAFDLRL